VLDKVSVVSVAVCDLPVGKYEFYGYVRYSDGTRYGERKYDQPLFDPAVLTEGERTYLYTGFCGAGQTSRKGAMATVLDSDMHIGTYKPAEKPMHQGGNNHGSIVEINGQWYIFYHRHTNGMDFCRQACAEPIEIIEDGKDGDEETGYVTNILDSCGVGFKYFECKDVTKVKIKTRGYSNGVFEVRTSWNGEALGSISIEFTNIWEEFSADISIPDGIHALYFIYKGSGTATLGSFTLE